MQLLQNVKKLHYKCCGAYLMIDIKLRTALYGKMCEVNNVGVIFSILTILFVLV